MQISDIQVEGHCVHISDIQVEGQFVQISIQNHIIPVSSNPRLPDKSSLCKWVPFVDKRFIKSLKHRYR